MNVLVYLDETAFEAAFVKARAVQAPIVSRKDGLPAFTPDAVLSWAERIWDSVEQALRDAYRDGRGAAQAAIDTVGAKIREAAAALGDQLSQLEEIIRQRLDAYFQSVVDAALGRIRSTIRIGDKELTADGATIQQSVKLSGSVKSKLDEICSFLAENQIEVSVSYKRAEP
jgi:hypothetical protein